MYSIGKLISNVKEFYNDINSATLTGAIDIVVVEQPNGTLVCSPFHVRFGKVGVLRSREKVVDIEVNEEFIPLQMKLDDAGVAFFVEEMEENGVLNDPYMMCSPIPPDKPHDMLDNCLQGALHQNDEGALMCSAESGQADSSVAPPCYDLTYTYQQTMFNSTALSEGLSISAFKIDVPTGGISKIGDTTLFESESTSLSLGYDSHTTTPFKCKLLFDSSTPVSVNDLIFDSTASSASGFRGFFAGPNELQYGIQVPLPETKEPYTLQQRKVDDNEVSHQSSESSCTYDTTPSEDEREKSEEDNEYFHGIPSSVDKLKIVADVPIKVISRDEDAIVPVKDMSKSSTVGVKRRRRKKIASKKASQKKSLSEIDSTTSAPQSFEEPKDVYTTGPYYTAPSMLGHDTSGVSTAYHTAKTASFSAEKISHSTMNGDEGGEDELSAALSRMQHSQMDENYAFFSDTELAEGSNDEAHFPSDTECFIKHASDEGQDAGQEQSWRWGELPTPAQLPLIPKKDTSSTAEETDENYEEKHDKQVLAPKQPGRLLFNMFNFMNMTKKIRRNPESEGIYLEDLDSGDITPEVAALYFPTAYRRSQLNQSTESSAVGGSGGTVAKVEQARCSSQLSETELSSQSTMTQESKNEFLEIALSLCGKQIYTSATRNETFENDVITYDVFVNDPEILMNPNLIVRLNGQYVTWGSALPQIMAMTVFKKCLPLDIVEKLRDKFEPGVVEAPAEHPSEEAQPSSATSYKLWLPWRRTTETKEIKLAYGDIPSKTEEDEGASCSKDDQLSSSVRPKSLPRLTSVLQAGKQTIPTIQKNLAEGSSSHYANINANDGSSGSGSSDDAELVGQPFPREAFDASCSRSRSKDKLHRKTLRLTSDQLVSLNLQSGPNKVVFSVTTAYQGTTRCMCHIYKWRYDDKIVISDIDGTITRSDVLGHVLPMLGKDWAQSGVTELFTKISNNGYKLLYLSARAIGQSDVTREYLKSVKQNNLSLPEGPVLLSPTSLLNAFHREVIEKKPEHFKIPCLKDLGTLFPPNREPLYAGFGNRDSDCFTYSMVGIPEDRIFTINSRGEVKHGLMQILISTYSNLTDVVDQMFPPSAELQEADRYSSFTHWRAPVEDIFEISD